MRLLLAAIQWWDRRRLRALVRRHPGLEIDPTASTNLALARFDLAPGAQLRIGAGVHAERLREGVRFHVGPGARMEIGEGCWLRSEVQPVHLVAFEGGTLSVGAYCFLNGCHLSAKQRVEVGEDAMIGPGSRVFDSDQHDLDGDRPEQSAPVKIGALSWVSSDVTVLKGVEIGPHCIVGTRALVGASLPPHTLAYGIPAEPRGAVGERKPELR